MGKNTILFISIFLSLGELFGQFVNSYPLDLQIENPTDLCLAAINQDEYPDAVGVATDNNLIYWMSYSSTHERVVIQDVISQELDMPNRVVSGYLNNDEFVDLLVGTQEGKLYLLYGQPTIGVFEPAVLLTDEIHEAADLIIQDINGDSYNDIITTNTDNDAVIALENQANGSFSLPFPLISYNSEIRDMLVHDMNQDNSFDVVTSLTDGNLIWNENSGSGDWTFNDALLIDSIEYGYSHIVAGDFDDDNDEDVFAVGRHTTGIGEAIYLIEYQENEAAYASPFLLGTNGGSGVKGLVLNPSSISDYLDLFVYGTTGVDGYRYAGNGFTDDIILSTSRTNKLLAADFDNSERIGYLAISSSFDQCTWWVSNTLSNSNPELYLVYDLSRIHEYNREVDINNDGLLDLITIGTGFEIKYYLKTNASGTYADGVYIGDLYDLGNFNDVIIQDINNDSWIDIVCADGSLLKLLIHSGEMDNPYPEITLETDLIPGFPFFSDISNIAVANINQDAFPDIIYIDEGKVYSGLNDQEGGFHQPNQLSELTASLIELIDFDGDADMDIVVYGGGFTGGLYLLRNIGFWEFDQVDTLLENQKINILTIRDIDMDGKPDILFKESVTDDLIWLRNLDTEEGFGPRQALVDRDNIAAHTFTDFDYDGDEDIVFTSNFGTTYYSLYAEGGYGPSTELEGLEISAAPFFFSDVDNDGDKDIIGAINRITTFLGHQPAWIENIAIDNNPNIKAQAFWDADEDQIYDEAELILMNFPFVLQPQALQQWSNESGATIFRVVPDDYNLMVNSTPNWSLTTSADTSISVVAAGDPACVDFGYTPTGSILSGSVDLSSGPTRCGFTVSFWLSYHNTGTVFCDGQLMLELDPLVTFQSAVPAPDSVSGQQLFWTVNDLAPTVLQNIGLQLEMPSVDFIGEMVQFQSSFFQTNSSNGEEYVAIDTYESTINCAYDPNDKLVEPSIPGYTNYTLFGDTLEYTIRFQNTGTDTAFTVIITDRLDEDLDWTSFDFIAASHSCQPSLTHDGIAVFRFDDILLPDSTTNEVASHGFVKFRINPKEGLEEQTIISNRANIYFDQNPPIVTNLVTNRMVSEIPLLFDVVRPSCYDTEDASLAIAFPEDALSYTWSTGETGIMIENLSAGSYMVTVTDIEGDTIRIASTTIYNPSRLRIDEIEVIDNLCSSDTLGSVTLDIGGGNTPYVISWGNWESNEAILLNLPAGSYPYVVTDANNCTITDTAIVNATFAITAEVMVTNEVENSMDGAISINPSGGVPPYAYTWSLEPSPNSPIVTDLTAGTYTVTITDANDCLYVEDIEVDRLVASDDISTVADVSIYPNPAQQEFQLLIKSEISNLQMKLVNVHGEVLLTENIQYNIPTWIECSDIPSGIYFLSFHSKEHYLSRKIIIID